MPSVIINPFTNQPAYTPSTGSSRVTPIENPFASETPQQTGDFAHPVQQPQSNPVKQIPSNFGLGDIIPKNILSGVNSFLGSAEKNAEQTVSNVESFTSNLGKSLNPLRLNIANSSPVTKAIGDIFNNLGTAPYKGKSLGNTNSDEVFTGDTIKDVVSKIEDMLPALLPGDGQAIQSFSKTKAAITTITQAAVQIVAGRPPQEIIQSMPFGLLGGIGLKDEPTSFTPAEIKGEVINTDLAKTPLGNELMKSALDAKPDDTIQISHDPTSNLKTETGFPVKVEVHPQPTSKINTPEREAMRQQITNDLYGEGAKVKEKRIDIVMGGPGSGKSTTLVDPLAQEHGSIVVDADKVKPKIPESNGGKDSNVVHQESSDIAEGRLLSKAMSNGDNIVLPLVGKNLGKMQTMIKGLNDAGYEVHLHHMSLPPEEAVARAEARFKSSGRYTDPNYILNEVGLKPDQNFDILKTDKGVKSYEKYSNNVPAGQAPKLLERSGRSETGQYIENSQTAKNPTVTEGTEGNRINSGSESKNPVNESKSVSTTDSGVRQELKVSKISKEIDAKAVEKGLTKGFSQLAGYDPTTVKEQSKIFTDTFNAKGEDGMRAIIRGEEPLPKGANPAYFIKGMEDHLIKNPNPEILQELVKSPLITKTSEAAQTLRMAAERDPYSPLSIIQKLEDDRRAVIEKQNGESISHTIKKDVAKGTSEINKSIKSGSTASKGKLADFIKSIQCS